MPRSPLFSVGSDLGLSQMISLGLDNNTYTSIRSQNHTCFHSTKSYVHICTFINCSNFKKHIRSEHPPSSIYLDLKSFHPPWNSSVSQVVTRQGAPGLFSQMRQSEQIGEMFGSRMAAMDLVASRRRVHHRDAVGSSVATYGRNMGKKGRNTLEIYKFCCKAVTLALRCFFDSEILSGK